MSCEPSELNRFSLSRDPLVLHYLEVSWISAQTVCTEVIAVKASRYRLVRRIADPPGDHSDPDRSRSTSRRPILGSRTAALTVMHGLGLELICCGRKHNRSGGRPLSTCRALELRMMTRSTQQDGRRVDRLTNPISTRKVETKALFVSFYQRRSAHETDFRNPQQLFPRVLNGRVLS